MNDERWRLRTNKPLWIALAELLEVGGPLEGGVPTPMKIRELERIVGLSDAGTLLKPGRTPRMPRLRQIANALGVPAAYFPEYRLAWVRDKLDPGAGESKAKSKRAPEARLRDALDWYDRLGLEEATARTAFHAWRAEFDPAEQERIRREVETHREIALRKRADAFRKTMEAKRRAQINRDLGRTEDADVIDPLGGMDEDEEADEGTGTDL